MTPTQPKDAEMDEKKFPIRGFVDLDCEASHSVTGDICRLIFHTNIYDKKMAPYLSLEEHQHILSEERARLAIAIEALGQIADPRMRSHKEPDKYTELACVMHIADQALEKLMAMESK